MFQDLVRVYIDHMATERTEEWWSADHYKSDSSYHTYCGTCYHQIPKWLVRWSDQFKPPFTDVDGPLQCEGCKKVAEVGP